MKKKELGPRYNYTFFLNQNESQDYPEEGWYFSDECEQLNGPFASQGQASDALYFYVKNVL